MPRETYHSEVIRQEQRVQDQELRMEQAQLNQASLHWQHPQKDQKAGKKRPDHDSWEGEEGQCVPPERQE
jgi:hypothetical protein